MQTAELLLQALGKLGAQRQPLTRVYRHLYNTNLYLIAYDRLSSNNGALTPGLDGQTIDGMSLERINSITEQLRYERYKWHPVRRVMIPKANGGSRPLGVPTFDDKLVQEVIRMLLNAYYEPQFCTDSHGYRPNRGCHTALEQVKRQFRGSAWFIEGDIKGCFDNIDHDVLMGLLSKQIQDQRLLQLIRNGLESGAISKDWVWEATYSGTPQGGVLSPLLANIYLDELDQFVNSVLKPKWNFGRKRQRNTEYRKYEQRANRAFQRGNSQTAKVALKAMRKLPAIDPYDPKFRRLTYVRYADDCLFGFIGSKAEAEEIRKQVGEFLQDRLKLQMSYEKTLITNARAGYARFLGYEIAVVSNNNRWKDKSERKRNGRSINGLVDLLVPQGLPHEKAARYLTAGKTRHEGALLHNSVGDTIYQFQARFRGLAEYYKYARNRHVLRYTANVMQETLVKTLAVKLRCSAAQVYQRLRKTIHIDGMPYQVLQETVRTNDKVLTFTWGGIPLTYHSEIREPLEDTANKIHWYRTSDRVTRLLANECELCGATGNVEAHHVHKLKDLRQKWRGHKELPTWVRRMHQLNRKTLYVCRECHRKIHVGTINVKLPTS